MKNPIALLVSFASASFLFVACESNAPRPSEAATGLDSTKPGLQDRIFVQEALATGANEIDMSRLGIQRAQNLDLRLLAQRIFDDHLRANKDLTIIAQQEKIPFSTNELHNASHVADIQNISGPDFDRVFLHHLVTSHGRNIKKFEAAARSANNPEIRTFAARTLPFLEEHQRIAENIGKDARLTGEINEAAGAERPRQPYYEGGQRPHQFNMPNE